MLAPRASSAFICIRCELTLSRTRLAVLFRRPSRASFSTCPTRRQDALDNLRQFQFPEPRPRSELIGRPLGRLRKRKGKASIRETTARLGGVKSLGDDAEILVLREEGDAPPETTPTPHVDTREPVDIHASIQQENAATDQDDVNRMLESLRPKTHAPPNEPQYIAQATFIKLTKALVGSFTAPQLSQYYTSQKGTRQRKTSHPAVSTVKLEAKMPIGKTEWHPGTSQLTRRLPRDNVSRKTSGKHFGKTVLADQILRTMWNVVLLEEIEAPGEIEMALKDWQLYLLNGTTTPTPLDRIGRERKAKLEIHVSQSTQNAKHTPQNTLRITANKSTAEYVADDVEKLLQNTEVVRLDLKPWLPLMEEDTVAKESTTKRLSPEILHTVGQLSGTYLQVETEHMILIRGLDKSSVDEARRGILQMIPFKPPPRYIDHRMLDAADEHSYLSPTAFKNFLDYRFRAQDLGRWSLPVPKAPNDRSTSAQEISYDYRPSVELGQNIITGIKSALQGTFKFRKHVPKAEADTQENSKVTKEFQVRTKLTAEVGQALVPLTSERTSNTSNAPFCHVFPGLSKILLGEVLSAEVQSTSPKLEYEFVANPSQANPLQEGQNHPTLIMKFRYQPGSSTKLSSVNIKLREIYHDVLLPDRAVDLRFRVTQEMVIRDLTLQPQMKAFVEAVCANIDSGARLTAPSSLQVLVPRSAIPGSNPRAKGDRLLEYFFTGVCYRQSVLSQYQEQNLSYSTTRAGKLGKKGGRLSIHYNHTNDHHYPAKDPKLANWSALDKFIKTSFAITGQITEAAANNKPMIKTMRPRDQLSARKMRRLALARDAEGEEGSADEDSHRNGGYTPIASMESVQDDQKQNDDLQKSFQVQEGDMHDPTIASFLSEETHTDADVSTNFSITEDGIATQGSGGTNDALYTRDGIDDVERREHEVELLETRKRQRQEQEQEKK